MVEAKEEIDQGLYQPALKPTLQRRGDSVLPSIAFRCNHHHWRDPALQRTIQRRSCFLFGPSGATPHNPGAEPGERAN